MHGFRKTFRVDFLEHTDEIFELGSEAMKLG